MSITLSTRLKVSAVSSVRDPEGRENIKIIFVELRTRPPMVTMVPKEVPKEISSVVFQVQQGLNKIIPRGSGNYNFQKIVLVFTPEELEAFNIKPYPNQIYEIIITDGALRFRNIKI